MVTTRGLPGKGRIFRKSLYSNSFYFLFFIRHFLNFSLTREKAVEVYSYPKGYKLTQNYD